MSTPQIQPAQCSGGGLQCLHETSPPASESLTVLTRLDWFVSSESLVSC